MSIIILDPLESVPVGTGSGDTQVIAPHFDLPFRFGGKNGAAVIVEQDSPEEILNGIRIIIAYPIGSREDLPEFGIPDVLFLTKPEDIVSKLADAIARWEPRAQAFIAEHPIVFDNLVKQFEMKFSGGSDT